MKAGLHKIEDNELNKEDLDTAREFLKEYGTLKRLTENSITKYRISIWSFLKELRKQGKNLASLDKKAALELIDYLSTTSWSEDSREDFWKRWLKFCEWAEEKNQWPDDLRKILVDRVKRHRYKIDKNKVTKKGIFSPEEILQLVHLETSPAYQTFWSVLYESGMRAGEAFALRLENVKVLQGRGYVLELPTSKTMKRTLPLVDFAKDYLGKWLQLHPDKNNPEAYLFVNTLGDRLENAAANKRLRVLLKASGMKKKKISLHSFRHSRATALCHHMTEAEMCAFFGWSIGSDMPATYIRAEAIDVTNALLRASGMEDKQHYEVKGRVCLSCTHLNPISAEWCDLCKLPLDPQQLETIKDSARAQSMFNSMREQLIADVMAKMSGGAR